MGWLTLAVVLVLLYAPMTASMGTAHVTEHTHINGKLHIHVNTCTHTHVNMHIMCAQNLLTVRTLPWICFLSLWEKPDYTEKGK